MDPQNAAAAKKTLADADYTGGLIVHLGCGDGRLTAALHAGDGSLVHGLDTNADQLSKTRQYLHKLGLYGSVSVDVFDGKHLPYADNLVNLIVATGECHVASDEILRVLAPGGVMVPLQPSASGLQPFTKPRPDEIDQWPHFLHNASGNALSKDHAVGPPRRLQWDGGPRWSRSHETDMSITAVVTSGGRIFHTLDEGPIGIHETPRDQRQLPDKCSLVARDAFNGLVLWKRPMSGWGSAAWDANRWRWGIRDQLWSSPLMLPRRLVASRDRVYVTLGFRDCVSELDAATGKTLREFHQTFAAKEIILSQGTLVVRVRDVSTSGTGRESIVALDVESGNVLWREQVEGVADLTLAALNGRVCFHNTRRLVALDLQTGEQLWQTSSTSKAKRETSAGTLVMTDDMIIFADGPRVSAHSAANGELLWRKNSNTSFRGMADVFVINKLAWVGTLSTTGLDLVTGEVARQIEPGHLYTGGHYARCYRGKATEGFLLWSKRGVEFLDLKSDRHMPHDWVRGTCRYGIIPANGLLYAPPHPCFCYPGVKLTGFNALAGESSDETPRTSAKDRLHHGPAFGSFDADHSSSFISGEWPTYRHDNARSGCAGTTVPTRLKRKWKMNLARLRRGL